MELREYVHVARKYWLMIVIVTVVLVAGSLLFRSLQPTTYSASRALTLSRVNTQKTTDYKYDDYYAIQAVDLFNKTVAAWLQTPSDVLDIYTDAGVSAPTESLNSLARVITTTKISPQVLQVDFVHGDKDQAQKIADSIVKIVQREVDKENKIETEQAYFHVDASNTVIVETPKFYALIAIVALLVGLFVSYNLALLLNYFSKGPKE
jgi:capsular polysaccharide biosynthesis protein